MPSLRCDRLSEFFGTIQALTDVSIEFPSSGIIAIIGPNGAGKTTLLNIVTGFLRPSSGRIFLDHQELTNSSPYAIARRGISRTFQDIRLISHVSVLENVLLARPNQSGERLLRCLWRHGVAIEEAQNLTVALRLLAFVGIGEKATELAGELSYGQQKLLTLACCFATEARILFLDEPVAGVHPELAMRISVILQQLRDEGKLIIFIEHDISLVRRVADWVVVMDEGRIIAMGKPGDVLERPEIMEAYVG